MSSPLSAVALVWLAWVASWLAGRLWADRAEARPRRGREMPYVALNVAGSLLMVLGRPGGGLPSWAPWRVAVAPGWSLVGLSVAGLAFTWWARLHLGRLWSSSVTRKAEHRIVDTGPYALVRHPIYTGLILAVLATGALLGGATACLGALLVASGMCVKARLEERFLREQLGAEAYDAYARRVPMLVPFLPSRRS